MGQLLRFGVLGAGAKGPLAAPAVLDGANGEVGANGEAGED